MPNMVTPDGRAAPTTMQQAMRKRAGTFLVKIGAMLEHRLERDLQLPSGRQLKRGGKIHVVVENYALLSEEDQKRVEWMCRNPSCQWDDTAGKPRRHASKRSCLVEHAQDDKRYQAEEDVHLVVGVGWFPAKPPKEEVRDKKTGELLEAADLGTPARLALFSDEE